MRAFLILALVIGLGGCQLIYKLPTRQGNVLDQKQLDQLKLGMTRDQVKFLIGTPVAASPFTTDRWDYIGYYRSPRGQVSDRLVTLYFQDDKLSRMVGVDAATNNKGAGTVDTKTAEAEKKKDALEAERHANDSSNTGVVMRPPAPEGPSTQEPDQIPNP
ncbi:MAG TPA: outer membrane protein assembly factor BamE [Stenotrophobium sp.]|jgi:outer membrane protein assembly factor BamE (lipoprotein component of BamABCDE complex)|nr:outer membrane protein assembly factor BamE [Stenotrophobium sp.]